MLLSQFFISDDTVNAMASFYDIKLVALSLLIAILTSTLCLYVVDIAQNSPEHFARKLAVASGAISLGLGVWAMHFIGMMALNLCTTVSYDWKITLLSILPSVFASAIALDMLLNRKVTTTKLIVSGTLVGAGIGLMHYFGMRAMTMSAQLRYDPYWFTLSIFIAVTLATLSLWFTYSRQAVFKSKWSRIFSGGVVMGLAVTCMHFAGMRAAVFIGVSETLYPVPPIGMIVMSVAIFFGVILVSLNTLLVNLFFSLSRDGVTE